MIKARTAILHDDRRPLRDGTFPVKLRVTHNRKQKYYSTSVSLTKEDFAKVYGEKPRTYHKNLLLKFREIEGRALQVIDKMSVFTFALFEKKFFDVSEHDNVFDAFTLKIAKLKEEGRAGTASNYECAKRSLMAFAGREQLLFSDVTCDYLKSYEKWMLNEEKSLTTVGIYLRPLRTLFNDAIAAGDINGDIYPFGKRKYQAPAGVNVKKALSLSDVGKIYKYEPVHDGEAKARDLWIFSYFCNGINVKDIARLKYKNLSHDKIMFIRAKTERTTRQKLKTIVAVVSPEMRKIIERWGKKPVIADSHIFPILEKGLSPEQELAKVRHATKAINKYIKRIAEAVGIKQNVSTYTARHSFSTVLKRQGVSTEFISESLGHIDLKTTENYLDSFEDDVKRKHVEKLSAWDE
ncbi:site-specific integrase [Pontibacter saemangeumensis]|uniref:Site-specific integrase n=1 Tax=Pontibacter saemangeumensis TaxID=1084525 RepID=A0ABP8LU64_9BACT